MVGESCFVEEIHGGQADVPFVDVFGQPLKLHVWHFKGTFKGKG